MHSLPAGPAGLAVVVGGGVDAVEFVTFRSGFKVGVRPAPAAFRPVCALGSLSAPPAIEDVRVNCFRSMRGSSFSRIALARLRCSIFC